MLERPLRCWGGLNETFAKYIFAAVHSFGSDGTNTTNIRVRMKEMWKKAGSAVIYGGRIAHSGYLGEEDVQHLWRQLLECQ